MAPERHEFLYTFPSKNFILGLLKASPQEWAIQTAGKLQGNTGEHRETAGKLQGNIRKPV